MRRSVYHGSPNSMRSFRRSSRWSGPDYLGRDPAPGLGVSASRSTRNLETIREEDWEWADIVLFSGVLVQKADLHVAIREAQSRGKPTVAGGQPQ